MNPSSVRLLAIISEAWILPAVSLDEGYLYEGKVTSVFPRAMTFLTTFIRYCDERNYIKRSIDVLHTGPKIIDNKLAAYALMQLDFRDSRQSFGLCAHDTGRNYLEFSLENKKVEDR